MSKVKLAVSMFVVISLVLCSVGGYSFAAPDAVKDTVLYASVENPQDTVVNFKDLYLKILIRQKLNKPVGNIYRSDVAKITELNLADQELTSISDLSYLTNLTVLYLDNNQISDISPLSGLTKLTKLKLSNNSVSSINALANLKNLTSLYLDNNQISDIGAISKLTKLRCLYLKNNKITDYSPVAAFYNNIAERDFTYTPQPPVKVTLNGKAVVFDAAPKVIQSKAMVSVKSLFTALGYKYSYVTKTKVITLTKSNNILVVKVDSTDATFNGRKIKLDAAVRLIDGKPFVPVKSICEKIGYKVKATSSTIAITG